MVKDAKEAAFGLPAGGEANCCNVEAVVSVDERGQMVLPKDIRAKAGIKSGDKLAIIAMRQDGRVCCLSLISSHPISSLGGMMHST
ncbi:MAG: HgcAB-associated protein [Chloroflexi bacterium]|nr:HgcAB-associated protein [Chloroflexota bacterium]